MTSTHRRNVDLMQKCALEVGTTLDRVKNWIGSEAVKRKRKAGILPRPKIEITGTSSQTKFVTPPAAKKFKRVNGYNLFFSYCVRTYPDISTDFRLRNACSGPEMGRAHRGGEEALGAEGREWCARVHAGAECTSSSSSSKQQQQHSLFAPSPTSLTPEITTETVLIEKTLLAIQEKFDLLEQLGFEGYAILVNTAELQTHLLATNKGKAFHRAKQMGGKPLENPLHWIRLHRRHCTCDQQHDGSSMTINCSTPNMVSSASPNKRFTDLISALNSTETMQRVS
eukprot:Em0425g4a